MKKILLSLIFVFAGQNAFSQNANPTRYIQFKPVDAEASLPTCSAPMIGQVRAANPTLGPDPAALFICDGAGTWTLVGPGFGIVIGEPVIGGTPNSTLYVDSLGNLADELMPAHGLFYANAAQVPAFLVGTASKVYYSDTTGDPTQSTNFWFDNSLVQTASYSGKLYIGATGTAPSSSSARFTIDSVLDGTSTDSSFGGFSGRFAMANTVTDGSTHTTGGALTLTGTSSSALTVPAAVIDYGLNVDKALSVSTSVGGATAQLIGVNSKVTTSGAGTSGTYELIGVKTDLLSSSSGTLSRAASLYVDYSTSVGTAGAITDFYDLYVDGKNVTGSLIVNNYGLYMLNDSGDENVGVPRKRNRVYGSTLFTRSVEGTSTAAVPAADSPSVNVANDIAWQLAANTDAGSLDNVDSDGKSAIRFTLATAITGFADGQDGKRLTILNAKGSGITIANLSGSSLAANQIVTGTGADITLASGASLDLHYDSTSSVWRVVGSVGSSGSVTADSLQLEIANQIGAVSYTVLSGTERYLRCDSTGGNVSYVLPAPSAGNDGTVVWIKRISGDVNNCEIDVTTNGTSLDGSAVNNTALLSSQYDAVAIISVNGVGWEIMP